VHLMHTPADGNGRLCQEIMTAHETEQCIIINNIINNIIISCSCCCCCMQVDIKLLHAPCCSKYHPRHLHTINNRQYLCIQLRSMASCTSADRRCCEGSASPQDESAAHVREYNARDRFSKDLRSTKHCIPLIHQSGINRIVGMHWTTCWIACLVQTAYRDRDIAVACCNNSKPWMARRAQISMRLLVGGCSVNSRLVLQASNLPLCRWRSKAFFDSFKCARDHAGI